MMNVPVGPQEMGELDLPEALADGSRRLGQSAALAPGMSVESN